MHEINEIELSEAHRKLLSNAIVKYLDGEIGIFELEVCISYLNKDAGSSDLIADIYHLLQQFDADDGSVSNAESQVMNSKVRNIANLLVLGNVSAIKKSISDFFSDPYGACE